MKINIKEETAKKLEKRVKKDDEFKDVEEYVNYVLAQIVEKLEEEEKDIEEKEEHSEEKISDEEEAKVKERLRALGYLD